MVQRRMSGSLKYLHQVLYLYAYSRETLLSRMCPFRKSRMMKSSSKVYHHPNPVVLTLAKFSQLSYSSQLWSVSSPSASAGVCSCQYSCLLGVCGTDGHIHEGEFISTFPVCMRFKLSIISHAPFQQLIPGHEAVGSIVELGKDVKNFAIGDRCVADVGITVSVRLENYGSMISLMTVSVTTAFTVAGVNHSCVRTTVLAELARRVDLPNTSPSTKSSYYLVF